MKSPVQLAAARDCANYRDAIGGLSMMTATRRFCWRPIAVSFLSKRFE